MFQIMIPAMVWLLGALGIVTVTGALMGFLIPLVTALFLAVVGIVFLSKGIEAMAVGSEGVGGFLTLMAFGSFVFALTIINPSILETPIGFDMGGSLVVDHVAPKYVYGALSVVPISSTVLSGASWMYYAFLGIVIYGFYALFFEKRSKIRRVMK